MHSDVAEEIEQLKERVAALEKQGKAEPSKEEKTTTSRSSSRQKDS